MAEIFRIDQYRPCFVCGKKGPHEHFFAEELEGEGVLVTCGQCIAENDKIIEEILKRDNDQNKNKGY